MSHYDFDYLNLQSEKSPRTASSSALEISPCLPSQQCISVPRSLLRHLTTAFTATVSSAPRRLPRRIIKALRLLEVGFHGAHELRLVTLLIAQLANIIKQLSNH
jgi:hypothetical protein